MNNKYEPFRDDIRATVYATVVKTRDTSTSYVWSLGKVISACAERCEQPLTNTPEDFKRIVKFEFDKLKTEVAINDSYELDRSKADYILRDGQIKGRLTNVYSRYVTLEKQLDEARAIFSRLGEKLDNPELSAEKRSALRKKHKQYLVVIDHCKAEIERQRILVEETKKEQEENEQVKADFKAIVKDIVSQAKPA